MLEVTEIIARRASAHDDVLRQTQPWQVRASPSPRPCVRRRPGEPRLPPQDYIDQKARERRGKRRSTDVRRAPPSAARHRPKRGGA